MSLRKVIWTPATNPDIAASPNHEVWMLPADFNYHQSISAGSDPGA